MFMFQENQEEPEALLRKPKKAAKKVVKSKEKVEPKKDVKAKVTKKKVSKATAKKAVKTKVIKPKTYKVAGTIKVDADGRVLKVTKSISSVKVSGKAIICTFIIKRK